MGHEQVGLTYELWVSWLSPRKDKPVSEKVNYSVRLIGSEAPAQVVFCGSYI